MSKFTLEELCLINAAKDMRSFAYAPYSQFHVGAALLTRDGQTFTGCNMENASFGATICAERVAFAKAITSGICKKFSTLAIAASHKENIAKPCAPCGLCRQVMAEFCDGDFRIIMVDEEDVENSEITTLRDIFPKEFDKHNLS